VARSRSDLLQRFAGNPLWRGFHSLYEKDNKCRNFGIYLLSDKNMLCICFITDILTVLQIRYAEHLPSVLKNINCAFPGRKKVGVVGRTGSGKSTLIQAIFRIVEPREGSIIIDDVDISKIGLQDLRSRLSIIPQDPTMFEGTVRGNLDPLGQYSDYEIWEVSIFPC